MTEIKARFLKYFKEPRSYGYTELLSLADNLIESKSMFDEMLDSLTLMGFIHATDEGGRTGFRLTDLGRLVASKSEEEDGETVLTKAGEMKMEKLTEVQEKVLRCFTGVDDTYAYEHIRMIAGKHDVNFGDAWDFLRRNEKYIRYVGLGGGNHAYKLTDLAKQYLAGKSEDTYIIPATNKPVHDALVSNDEMDILKCFKSGEYYALDDLRRMSGLSSHYIHKALRSLEGRHITNHCVRTGSVDGNEEEEIWIHCITEKGLCIFEKNRKPLLPAGTSKESETSDDKYFEWETIDPEKFQIVLVLNKEVGGKSEFIVTIRSRVKYGAGKSIVLKSI